MADTPSGDQAASPQSLYEKIASAFGETPEPKEQPVEDVEQPEEVSAEATEESTESEEAQQHPAEEFVEIEFEGEKLQLPAHLSKVKDALLRQADYTQKTQQVAEARKALEAAQEAIRIRALGEAFQKETATEREHLTILDAAIQQAKQLDWASMSTDQIVRARLELDNYKEQRASLAESLKSKEEQFKAQVAENVAKHRAQVKEHVSKTLQGFDEAVVTKTATDLEFTSQEIEMLLTDPRATRMAWEAAQYRNLQAQRATAAEKAKSAPPVIKPSAHRPMPDAVKEKLSYRKALKSAPNSQAAAKLIEQRLAKAFGA